MSSVDSLRVPVKKPGFWQVATARETLTLIVGSLYVVSPIDFIPEAALGPLGLLDDGGAAIVVLMTVIAVMKRRGSGRSASGAGDDLR